jgi:DNA-binding NarL/FixJ family response regulator
MSAGRSWKLLIAVEDLFFVSRIQSCLAGRPEVEAVWLQPGDDLAERCRLERPSKLLLDLQAGAFRPLEGVARIKASAATSSVEVIAFLPHVRLDLRAEAKAAGVDRILTNSALAQVLPRILEGVA